MNKHDHRRQRQPPANPGRAKAYVLSSQEIENWLESIPYYHIYEPQSGLLRRAEPGMSERHSGDPLTPSPSRDFSPFDLGDPRLSGPRGPAAGRRPGAPPTPPRGATLWMESPAAPRDSLETFESEVSATLDTPPFFPLNICLYLMKLLGT